MSDSSDVEAFILTEVCKELEKNIKKKRKRIWTNDIFVSRRNVGGFHTLFQRLRKDPVNTGIFPQEYCVSHQVKLSSVFAPPM
jgi:hypothetical protein